MLILFDRLFGTFAEAPRREAMRYGLVGVRPSYNPLRIVFGEWAAMFAAVRAARDWRGVLAALFAPPGAARPASDPAHDRRFAI